MLTQRHDHMLTSFPGLGCARTNRSLLSSVCTARCSCNDLPLMIYTDINNPTSFKKKLQTKIAPLITSTAQLLSPKFPCPVLVNFAISQSGLNALNITGNLGDTSFPDGQFKDAANLVGYSGHRKTRCVLTRLQGDPGTGEWVEAFKGTNINGVFLIAR